MSEEIKKKRTVAPVERVVLYEDAIRRLDGWLGQVRKTRPGVDVTRRDIVQWLIMSHDERLSPGEEKALGEAHYNELRFLQYAIQEIRNAKARGENISLQDFISSYPVVTRHKSPKAVSKKAKTDKNGELEATTEPEDSVSHDIDPKMFGPLVNPTPT